jgi:hypothetical protein
VGVTSKKTVIELFDDKGQLIKRTTITEDDKTVDNPVPPYDLPNTSPGYPGQIQVWNTSHTRLTG